MRGQDDLQGLLGGPDLSSSFVSFIQGGNLLTYLGQQVCQDKVSVGACLLQACLAGAVLVHAVVYQPTVEAGPGQVCPEISVPGEEGGDGGGDAWRLAAVVPGHGSPCG